ncbi:hypothetical protein TNCT_40661 [Trichonephila clavata]|uniref:Uncharacterized protein n=1 Tax=Trichonephila clavata TaxID=2740835 RepID=A0A8X6KQS6_TRICU|nr:hypothetical protein TNCT_40661 [Trichonephila clavata]
MSKKTVEIEMKEAEQERPLQSNHPGDSSSIRDESGSSSEERQSDNTSESSTKESSSKDSTLNYTSLTGPICLFYRNVFTKQFCKGLDFYKKKEMSDKEFALMLTQWERIKDIIILIQKAIDRCKEIEKIRIKNYLGKIYNSSTRTSEGIKDAKLKLKERIDKSQMNVKALVNVHKCVMICRKFDNNSVTRFNAIFGTYFKQLVKAKSQRKFQKGEKYEKLNFPENARDLDAPIDRHIALLLSALLNCTEIVLLPALRELEVLPKSNLTPKKYCCRDTTESIREHMAILEEVLSDSNDLKSKTEYIFDYQKFLEKSRELMEDCIFRHDQLRSQYNSFSESIKKLDKMNLPVMPEKYEETTYAYFTVRTGLNALKNTVRQCILVDQRRLQKVSKYCFELVDQVELGDIFLAILHIFAWLPTVSATYAYFIEDYEMHLNVYGKTLSSLVHGDKDE